MITPSRVCCQLELLSAQVQPWPKWGTHTHRETLRLISTTLLKPSPPCKENTEEKRQGENQLKDSKCSTVTASCQNSFKPVLLPLKKKSLSQLLNITEKVLSKNEAVSFPGSTLSWDRGAVYTVLIHISLSLLWPRTPQHLPQKPSPLIYQNSWGKNISFRALWIWPSLGLLMHEVGSSCSSSPFLHHQ